MRKTIMTLCVLALALSASACSVNINFSSGAQESAQSVAAQSSADSSAAEETTLAPETSAPVVRRAEDFVVTETECTINYSGSFMLTGEESGSSKTARARLPQLTIDSADASVINADIHEKLDHCFEYYDKHPGSEYSFARADYICTLNDSALSLVAETRSVDIPNSWFNVYNIDVETGSRIDNDAVLALAGVSKEDAQNAIISDMNKRCRELEARGLNETTLGHLETARQRTVAQENLDKADYFLDSEGRLCIAYRYYWFAGAENYGTFFVC